ncbi:hypothetical protein D3C85_1202040 [compost metagenome]
MGGGEPDVEVIANELKITALQITPVIEGTVVEADSARSLIDLAYHLTTRPRMVDVDSDDAIDTDGGLRIVDHLVVPRRGLAGPELLAPYQMNLRNAKG